MRYQARDAARPISLVRNSRGATKVPPLEQLLNHFNGDTSGCSSFRRLLWCCRADSDAECLDG
jgi:hypothetical protein